jgi:hypothetical protein
MLVFLFLFSVGFEHFTPYVCIYRLQGLSYCYRYTIYRRGNTQQVHLELKSDIMTSHFETIIFAVSRDQGIRLAQAI